jgi:hypothetical protein
MVGTIALAAIACGPGGRRGGDGSGTDGGDGSGSGSGGIAKTCAEAQDTHASVGCEYYAVDMDAAQGPPQDACFAVFIANTSASPVHIQTEWHGTTIDMSKFAKLPQGQGQSLTYGNYDVAGGLAPGQVAILFLAYQFQFMNVACPVPAAIGHGPQLSGTGKNWAFHITTDNPVVAYQMLPYGGGAAAATGASLLLPTTAWGTNYVSASAYDQDSGAPPIPIPMGPSHNYVAMTDNTSVTIRPKSGIDGGGGLGAGPAGQPYTVKLAAGEYFQITQQNPLSGSPVSSDQPIGVLGGHQIMSIDRCCGDHGEQMLAPVRALGYQYVAAPHPDRKPSGTDPRVYRIYGAVDNTQLVYDPPGLGPASLNLGDHAEIRTDGAFVVTSQDQDHPFETFTYMTGAGEMGEGGWGDPDFVRVVPPAQYMSHYVFFTDVTYPFTGLTVTRQAKNGTFSDVTLDCLSGPVTGWQPVGTTGDFEIAYVKLVDHWNGQNGCNNGVHNMTSANPFGLWVWGWGSEDTSTGWVSYGYPAGENVLPINDVIIE